MTYQPPFYHDGHNVFDKNSNLLFCIKSPLHDPNLKPTKADKQLAMKITRALNRGWDAKLRRYVKGW